MTLPEEKLSPSRSAPSPDVREYDATDPPRFKEWVRVALSEDQLAEDEFSKEEEPETVHNYSNPLGHSPARSVSLNARFLLLLLGLAALAAAALLLARAQYAPKAEPASTSRAASHRRAQRWNNPGNGTDLRRRRWGL